MYALDEHVGDGQFYVCAPPDGLSFFFEKNMQHRPLLPFLSFSIFEKNM
jgi:hypothetical protein